MTSAAILTCTRKACCTKELAIDGRTTGEIETGETVTWQARHRFKTRQLKVKIISMVPDEYFADEMVSGDFNSMLHQHYFSTAGMHTIMKDVFRFELPYGILGKLACRIFLTRYMTRLLTQRNSIIKKYAEAGYK